MSSSINSALRITFWSLIGRMWDEQAPMGPHVQRVVEIVQTQRPPRGARLVDVGCGTGVYAFALAEVGYDVTGVDAAKGMLARARLKLTPPLAARLRFEAGNLDARLPYDDAQFDVAIAISVLQAVCRPQHAGAEILRILKPGGIFVVLHTPRPAYHDHPLWQQIQYRIRMLKRKTARNIILASVKIVAERASPSLYWTVAELHARLEAQGFQVVSTPETTPIIVVAKKPLSAVSALE